MVTDKKALRIFDVMMERGLIPRSGTFEVTDELCEASYLIFRDLFSPSSYRMRKNEIRHAKKIAGLNMMKLNVERSEIKTVQKKVTSNNDLKCGFVYLISNPSFPGKFKVGMTQDMEKRLAQYQTYDPYRRYKIEHYKFVSDRRSEEKRILETYSIDLDKGEWVSEEQVKDVFLV